MRETETSKCVTDITEIRGKDGKLYTSVIFDCFDLTSLEISMDSNMKAELCAETVKNAVKSKIHSATFHGYLFHFGELIPHLVCILGRKCVNGY